MYQCQFLMAKCDRVIYGTPIMEWSGKAIASFLLAFTVEHKRKEYLEECIGYFAILKTDIDFCISENIIHFRRRKITDDQTEAEYASSKKIEILKLIAQIDNDVCKWRASLAKSKPLCVKPVEHRAT